MHHPAAARRGASTAALVVVLAACAASPTRSDEADVTGADAETVMETTSTTSPVDDDTAPTIDPPTEPADGSDDDELTTTGELPEPEFAENLRVSFEYLYGSGPGRIESERGYAPLLLEPGSYETDALGTTLRFSTGEPIRLVSERRSYLVLVDDDAEGLWDVPLVHVVRPHRLVDPSDTTNGPPAWPATIDGWDLDAWFAALPGIDVERTDVTVDGTDAVRYDVTIPDDGTVGWQADADVWVVPFFWRYGQGPHDLPSVDLHRVWLVPQGEHAPIIIHAATDADEGWGEFGDELDALVGSIELGDPLPIGIDEPLWESGLSGPVPAGAVRLPILGGVEFEVPADVFLRQERGWSTFDIDAEFDFYPPNVEVAAAAATIDGEPIESAEQLADLVVDLVGATRRADGEIDGRPAAVVEMLGVQPGIPVFRHVDVPPVRDPGLAAWFTLDYVELWAVDTEDGVLILTAEGEDPEGLDAARAVLDGVRATLTIG